MITSVVFTKTSIAPFVPAGTTAALATTLPSNDLRIETSGTGRPEVGQAVR
jgi:hypothetical protein